MHPAANKRLRRSLELVFPTTPLASGKVVVELGGIFTGEYSINGGRDVFKHFLTVHVGITTS